ncbi:MAG: type II toxin-antitoxin system RelB/DinJ family antitoxin [Verrucomicrobia bacterium]|jgi:DNA-damage-inducible protein J|nr:type II toxin-antitoxin system RelB/DinJ family antitoxin [Verrucomicrobiota bacterium]MDA1048219.1 type II toxin-antitoxin system RelB/DinJ family antitoxin [Verrucomicrobiota bacterium]
MKTCTIHAGIDEETKASTEEVLRSIGMKPSDAVRLLYRQISLRKKFPLELRVPNKLTTETIEKAEKGEKLESFDSLEELFESWKDE